MENEKLFAEFMELEITGENKTTLMVLKDGFNQQTKFNTSWGWIMEAVEKIETVKDFDFTVYINNHCCKIGGFEKYPELHIVETSTTKKQAVYNACVVFIKWYNKQN